MKLKLPLFTAVVLASATVLAASAQNGQYGSSSTNGMMLRGHITNAPAAGGLLILPSSAGPAVVTPNGQLMGTVNMQNGQPTGTYVIPSAIGPIGMGPRGEMRGTMESLGKSAGIRPPLFGLGPNMGYSAVSAVGVMRSLFAPGGVFPLSGPVMVLPVNAQQGAINGYPSPYVDQQGFARVIPRTVDEAMQMQQMQQMQQRSNQKRF